MVSKFFSWSGSIKSTSKNYWVYSAISLLIFFAVILIRYPGFVLEPRIYGEDSIYYETFLHAENWKGFDALIYPAYYIGFSRLAAYLASLVELEAAATVMTWFGFLVLITPILILFFTDCKYWDSLQKKIVLSCFLIFSCSSGEIWLTSTNLSFILSIGTFLILLDSNLENKAKRNFYYIYIACAVFNGPITLIMAPFFVLRYLQTRQKPFLNYCLILLFLGLLHVLYFWVSSNAGLASPSRFAEGRDLVRTFIFMVSSNIFFPLVGYFLAIIFRIGFDTVYIGIENSSYITLIEKVFPGSIGTGIKNIFYMLSSVSIILIGLCFAVLYFVFYKEFKRSNQEERVYFLSLFIYLSIVLTYLSLGGLGGWRYSYITGFILLFYLYQRVSFDMEKAKMTLAKFLLIFSITIGMVEYYPRIVSVTPVVLFGEEAKWPNWKKEVGLWRNDKSYQPKVWAYAKKSNGIWPERTAIWLVDLNEPQTWKRFGEKTFSGELQKIFSPEKTK
jgi:hypothetical protein